MKIVTLNVLLFACLTLPDSAHNISFKPFGATNIVLKSFLASTDGKSAHLTWELAEMEQDVYCYIERSEDGRKFSAIETMHITKGFNGVMSRGNTLIPTDDIHELPPARQPCQAAL